MTEFDIGVATLSDYDEDGHLQIQTDSPGVDGNEGTQPAEALATNGVHMRPLDPDKGDDGAVGLGGGVLIITIGDRRYAIPLGDPREVADNKIPKLRKGGAMLAGGAGDHRSFVLIDGEDPAGAKNPGSITVSASYTKNGAKKSLGFSMNVRDSGQEELSLLHGNGQRVTMAENGVVVTNAAGDAYIECGPDGNVFAGDAKVQGSLTVGQQLAALPVAIGPVVAGALSALAAAVASSAPGAPAAIVPFLPLLSSKHLKTS